MSEVWRDPRVGPRRSARCKMRGVRSGSGCGVTEYGADGPARRSSSVSRAWWRGHRQFLAAGRRGPPQDDQAVKTKLLSGSCLRILDQSLGPSRARSSRNRPLEPLCTMAERTQGWAGHPCHTRRMRLTSTGTPAQVVDAPCSVTRWASRKCSSRFTSLAPLQRRAARGSSAHRTSPWPQRRSLRGWSAVFLKPQFRAHAERPGFPTANDHVRTTQQHDAPFQNPPQFDPELIEVTDPAHPLFGRRFPVLSVSQNPQPSGHIPVAYLVPCDFALIAATDRNLVNASRPRTKDSMVMAPARIAGPVEGVPSRMRRSPRTVWHRLPDGLKQQIIEEFTDIFKEAFREHIRDRSLRSPRSPRRRLRPPIDSSPDLGESRKSQAPI